MRDIIFREYDKEIASMNYSPIIDIAKPKINSQFGNSDRYILMQFVGLRDKNGKPIYEGDIVATYGTHYGDWYVPIKFENGTFGYCSYDAIQIKNIDGWAESLKKTFPNEEKKHDQVKTTGFVVSYFLGLDKSSSGYTSFDLDNCEIIGNIYENPELLDGRS